ncbi:hypothetical protein LRA02_02770 [Lentilactobacillus rapi]|uniref:Uncharacterized protein n=1 Tax=Lentilactobacillus rapi TaxID=481723 RepID=A0A512PJN9_9LACO|nr:hypothetical protein LRA02_02770 [Lentilactobacillus rapi]
MAVVKWSNGMLIEKSQILFTVKKIASDKHAKIMRTDMPICLTVNFTLKPPFI